MMSTGTAVTFSLGSVGNEQQQQQQQPKSGMAPAVATAAATASVRAISPAASVAAAATAAPKAASEGTRASLNGFLKAKEGRTTQYNTRWACVTLASNRLRLLEHTCASYDLSVDRLQHMCTVTFVACTASGLWRKQMARLA